MKKILIVLSTLLLLLTPVFATAEASTNTDSTLYAQIEAPFVPLDARGQAMGGVGVTGLTPFQSLWQNAAGLSDHKAQVSLPSLGITIYNPVAIATSGVLEGGSQEELMNVMFNEVLKPGYGKILDVNSAVGFTGGGLGLGVMVQDSLYTYAPKTTTGGMSTNIIDQLTVDIRTGYGWKFEFGKNFSLDAGMTAGFRYMVYNKAVDAKTAMGLMGNKNATDYIMSKVPLMAGWTVPFNFGFRLNMPGDIKLATAINNISAGYKMQAFESFNEFAESKGKIDPNFKLKQHLSVDLGLAWEPDWSTAFNPTLEVDFVDAVGFFKAKDFTGRGILNHVKAGAEIKGLWSVDLRAGFNSGYWSLGCGLDLRVLRIEASYFWQEFGSQAGEKGIDGLTVQCNIGW